MLRALLSGAGPWYNLHMETTCVTAASIALRSYEDRETAADVQPSAELAQAKMVAR
jgi:hypothetical protein